MCNNRVNFSIVICVHCGLAVALLYFNLGLGPKLSEQTLSGTLTEGTENSETIHGILEASSYKEHISFLLMLPWPKELILTLSKLTR